MKKRKGEKAEDGKGMDFCGKVVCLLQGKQIFELWLNVS